MVRLKKKIHTEVLTGFENVALTTGKNRARGLIY